MVEGVKRLEDFAYDEFGIRIRDFEPNHIIYKAVTEIYFETYIKRPDIQEKIKDYLEKLNYR